MTIRNLDKLFRPQSVAIIGASTNPLALGHVLARNMLAGGFGGEIAMINPKYTSVLAQPCLPSIDRLPVTPDLAVIATPAATIPTLIRELAARGTKAAIVISAGFAGAAGVAAKAEILEAARPYLMRLVGPNCLGVLVPGIGLDASFAHLQPTRGSIAFLAQSGAILTSALDWAAARGIGFSHLVSMGEMLDVDFGDMLDYLAGDSATSAILIYAEAITNARKFVSAARRAARLKPVIIIKSGRHSETAGAVESHTGALAGSDAVYDAVFRRIGILRVDDLDELFAAMETLALIGPVKGDRLTIVTNGGGAGILAADALIADGGRLTPLNPGTIAKLDQILPVGWSRQNPVDIIGDADAARYRAAIDILTEDPDTDALMVLNSPTALTSSAAAAEAVITGRAQRPKPLLAAWIGEQTARGARARFAAAHIPSYATPEQAVRAFMHTVRYGQNRLLLAETPPSLPADFVPQRAMARAIIDQALHDGRDFLTAPESMALLRAYGIATVTEVIARTPAEAGVASAKICGPIVLKLLSPDITHKSDVGGVVLDLRSAEAVERAATRMLHDVRQTRPDARIDGFTLSPMIDRGTAHELIVGAAVDPQFGPVILFGQGGTSVEVTADRALSLPPLNLKLAQELVAGTRIAKLLKGYRDRPAADLAGIALVLIKVSQLITDFAEIVELDINPLLAGSNSVIALDARIRVKATKATATERLAIKPYPTELEERISLPDGGTYLIRPIRPEDEAALQTAFKHLSAESIELRFFRPLVSPSHQMIAALTQIDYDREMALIVTDLPTSSPGDIYADVRLLMDPDRVTAEYAIIVRDDMVGQGLGTLLMERIIAYARALGLARISGSVLGRNTVMLDICRKLGFTQTYDPAVPNVVQVSKKLPVPEDGVGP